MKLEQVKIAITLDNGDLSIMSFLTVGRGNVLPYGAEWVDQAAGFWRRRPTDTAVLDELTRAFPEFELDESGQEVRRPQPVRFRRLADSDIPIDRTYRGAWREENGRIVHDMPKARELHLARVRAARAPKLAELDRDWMRATGQGNTIDAKQIEHWRQNLRDLPQELKVESAKSIDDLKKLWPKTLE